MTPFLVTTDPAGNKLAIDPYQIKAVLVIPQRDSRNGVTDNTTVIVISEQMSFQCAESVTAILKKAEELMAEDKVLGFKTIGDSKNTCITSVDEE